MKYLYNDDYTDKFGLNRVYMNKNVHIIGEYDYQKFCGDLSEITKEIHITSSPRIWGRMIELAVSYKEGYFIFSCEHIELSQFMNIIIYSIQKINKRKTSVLIDFTFTFFSMSHIEESLFKYGGSFANSVSFFRKNIQYLEYFPDFFSQWVKSILSQDMEDPVYLKFLKSYTSHFETIESGLFTGYLFKKYDLQDYVNARKILKSTRYSNKLNSYVVENIENFSQKELDICLKNFGKKVKTRIVELVGNS